MRGRVALVVVAMVVGSTVAACSLWSYDESDVGTASVVGRWNLVAASVDGVETPVQVGVNSADQPFVELAGGADGNTGCNRFAATGAPPYEIDGDIMRLNEVNQTAQDCGELSEIETSLAPFLFSDGFTVRTSTDQDEVVMRWIGPDATLEWVRISR